MKRSTRMAFAAIAVVASASVAAIPAWAGTTSSATLSGIKSRAASAISLRQSALSRAITAVDNNRWLASDRSTLLGILDDDQSSLTALGPQIQADNSVSQARTQYESIFTTYRVFALAIPQVRLSAAANDLNGGAIPRLQDAHGRLEALLSGTDSSKDTSAVQAAMSSLSSEISAATAALSGLPASVLALVPSDYNANHEVLAGPRSQILDARSDALAARSDVLTVIGAIK